MLTLIGLGLNDEKDITLKGIEEANRSDKVYIELYTSKWHGSLENLEKLVGKKIQELARKYLEDDSKKIVSEAKNNDIAIFVLGDPLVATTHTILLQEARKQNIKIQIIHNASIISAIGETGLHLYKFGQTVTIPFPEKTKNHLPESVYNAIAENKKLGLHTLCLLDVVSEENKYMTTSEGIKIILSLEKKFKKKIFTEDMEVVVFARAGSNDSQIVYGKVRHVSNKDFGETPHVLIVPGKLHFTEKEFLESLKKS